MSKRVILEETQGPRAGLRHIMGTDDELAGKPFPFQVDNISIGDRIGSAHLIAIKPRLIFYREIPRATAQTPTV